MNIPDVTFKDSAAAVRVRSRWETDIELRRLKRQGISVVPSDAQQMLLEMVPAAMWEITRVREEVDITHLTQNTVTIETRVTSVRLIDDDTDMVIDVLNKETITERLPR